MKVFAGSFRAAFRHGGRRRFKQRTQPVPGQATLAPDVERSQASRIQRPSAPKRRRANPVATQLARYVVAANFRLVFEKKHFTFSPTTTGRSKFISVYLLPVVSCLSRRMSSFFKEKWNGAFHNGNHLLCARPAQKPQEGPN